MDIVLILICITCSASVIALIIRVFWLKLHKCVPRLPFREKWPPIALSVLHVIVVILLVVFVVLHSVINLNQMDKYYEKIKKIVKDFESASKTARTKLSAVIIPTIIKKEGRFSQSNMIVTEIRKITGFNEVESFPEQNRITDYEPLLEDMKDSSKCDNIDNSYLSSIETHMNTTSEDVNGVVAKLVKLSNKYAALQSHVNGLVVNLNTEITHEERRMKNYLNSTNSLYDDIDSSLKTTKTVIAKNMEQSNEISIYIEELLTIYLPAILVIVFTVICILLNTNKIKSNMHRIQKILCFGFFILLLTAIASSGWQVYLFAKTTDDCPEKPFDLLNFNLNTFNNDNPDDTISANDALLNCSRTHETFFFASENQFRISESIFIRNYKKEFSEVAINTFKYNNEFEDVVLLKGTGNSQNLYNDMEKLISKCSDANIKQNIEDYRNALKKIPIYLNKTGEFRENLKNIPTLVSPIIETNLRAVNGPLSKPVNDISNALSEADLDCHTVVEAFSMGLNPCKVRNKSVKSWTQCIAIICCALSAILYFLAFRRTDTKQFKFDNRQIWARTTILKPVQPSQERVDMLAPEVEKSMVTVKNFHDNPRKKKFQFANYECNYETRVVLKDRPDDFIHASWVRIPENKRSYIVTQSPLPNTMTDFWSMCDQEDVKTILMLGEMVDNNVQCCAPYFPNEVNQTGTYENFQVTCTEIKSHPVKGVSWKVLKLVNSLRTDAQQRMINHVQLPCWEERKFTYDPNQFIDLYLWVNKINKGTSPICVHSYLGRGRAGTYVFFDYAYSQIQKDPGCRMVSMLTELRKMRNKAVRSVEQTEFVELCMVILIIQDGILDISEASKYFEARNVTPMKKLTTAENVLSKEV